MFRLLPLFAFLLVAAPMFAGRASAVETWCADDPVVSVNGRLVEIQVQMPTSMVATMRSTTLKVIVPNNVAAAVVVDDVSAFPMETTISPTGPKWDGDGPLPITIVVDVTASTSYEFRVVATQLRTLGTSMGQPTTATGTTNIPLRMPMSLEM